MQTITWEKLKQQSSELVRLLVDKEMTITTAESCTGGLIAATLTSVPGASDCFMQAFVTYSNDAKQDLLQVSTDTLSQYGAVSCQTAKEMAIGALQRAGSSIAVAVTGIAGPAGGTKAKPVGTVYFGYALNKGAGQDIDIMIECTRFDGDREQIRMQAVYQALLKVHTLASKQLPI